MCVGASKNQEYCQVRTDVSLGTGLPLSVAIATQLVSHLPRKPLQAGIGRRRCRQRCRQATRFDERQTSYGTALSGPVTTLPAGAVALIWAEEAPITTLFRNFTT